MLFFACRVSWTPRFAVTDEPLEVLYKRYTGAIDYCLEEAPNLQRLHTSRVRGGWYYMVQLNFVEYWGGHAQFLRLMAWISCGRPEFRESLLAAWLVERGEAPSWQVLEAAIRRLAVSHTEADVGARIQEARKVLRQYGSMKKELLEQKVVHVNGEKIGMDRETGMKDLDYVIRETRTDRFLGVDLFYMSPGQRRAFYEGIPMAPGWHGIMPYEYPWAGFNLYVLLWRYEPDASIRRDVLVPRMEKLGCHDAGGIFVSLSAKSISIDNMCFALYGCVAGGDPVYWGQIADSQRQARLEEVRPLQEELVRLGEEEQARMEQKWRRIAAEKAAEEASSTSPTLTRFPRPTGMPKGADGASARNE